MCEIVCHWLFLISSNFDATIEVPRQHRLDPVDRMRWKAFEDTKYRRRVVDVDDFAANATFSEYRASIGSRTPENCMVSRMRKLLVLLGGLVALVIVTGGVILWLLQDPNRYKPELESLIADAMGVDLKIDGDLSWQLWPPVTLSAADISFADEETNYQIGSLGVQADLRSLLTGDRELKLQNIRVSDLVITDKELGDITRVHRLQLDDFVVGKPSPLSVQATLESPDKPTVEVALQTQLTYNRIADSGSLQDMSFDYDGIKGTCDVALSHLGRKPLRKDKRSKDDVLPLSTFRSMDWVADCSLPEYMLGQTVIHDITVHSENKAAHSRNVIKVPDLFGGWLQLIAEIDTVKKHPAWKIETDAKDLDSQQVASLISPRFKWAAPLLVGGVFTMTGNTPQAMVNSMAGTSRIDAGQGDIDISLLKEAVMEIAMLAGKSEQIANWPEQLHYATFTGDWTIEGTQQTLALVLDNINLDGKGEVNALTGVLDMVLRITINEHPTLDVLNVNKALYGVPIPVRCKGFMTEPQCGLDTSASKQIVKDIAAGQARRKVDEKLDEAIADKVPEAYQEDARKLIEGLLKRK